MSMHDTGRTINVVYEVPCTMCAGKDVLDQDGRMLVSFEPDANHIPITGEPVTVRVRTKDRFDTHTHPSLARTVRGIVRSVDKAAEYPNTVVEIEEAGD